MAVFAGDHDQISNVNKLERALEAVVNNECEGAKIHSRVRWIEEGEKPTHFFFRLERKRAEKIFLSLCSMNLVRKSFRIMRLSLFGRLLQSAIL